MMFLKKHIGSSSRPHVIVTVMLLLTGSIAYPHSDRGFSEPSAEQMSKIMPSIPGAVAFADSLAQSASALLTGQDHALLDEVQAFYVQAETVAKNNGEQAKQQAEYYRWQAETHLMELTQSMKSMISIIVEPGKGSGETSDILRMPGESGVILLKITTGNDSKCFSVQTLNLRREGPPEKTTIMILKSGVTYLFLQLEEIPSAESIQVIAFRCDDDPKAFYWHGFHLKREPLGQLTLSVFDEKNQMMPVLVRLTARSDGRLFEPPNAVDLNPIMYSITFPGMMPEIAKTIYGPGRGFQYYIHGPFQGRYWVVPGGFEMSLPGGEYDIHIYRGPEYIPFMGVVKVTPNTRTAKEYTLKQWENMMQRGWYSGDDHVHARLMHSEDAFKLLTCAKATDTHVANILEMGDSVRTWYAQRGFGKDYRVQSGDYILVPGQEDPRSALGHIIGLNLKSMVRDLDRYLQNDWIADQIHAQGGLYGVTHVGEKECLAHRDLAMSIPQSKVDFTSILQNRLGTEWYYDFLNLGYRVVASAGSDTPYGGFVGSVRVYAFIGKDKPFTADAWFEAFAAGKTFVTNGPMLQFTVDGKLPGEEIVIDAPRIVHVKAKAWGIAGLTAPTTLKIVVMGETVKEAQPVKLDDDAIEIEMDIECGYGVWIAAHAIGQGGFGAHTTPVYVRRGGFRHWNTDKAKGIIARQLSILDEIEAMIVESEMRQKTGALTSLDYWNRRIIDQAEPLRRRIREVRAIYADLERTLKKEVAVRQKSL